MEAKLCLCVMLIFWGTLTVQGAIPRNEKKNPWEFFARQSDSRKCFFDQLMTNLVAIISF